MTVLPLPSPSDIKLFCLFQILHYSLTLIYHVAFVQKLVCSLIIFRKWNITTEYSPCMCSNKKNKNKKVQNISAEQNEFDQAEIRRHSNGKWDQNNSLICKMNMNVAGVQC